MDRKHWCQDVRARAEKMLPSSSTTPAAGTVVSSEALTTMTLPVRSPRNVDSKHLAKESESDVEEEAYVSQNDLKISGEQSHTVEEGGDTNSIQSHTVEEGRDRKHEQQLWKHMPMVRQLRLL